MFTEDYLMRILNQVLAALLSAAGLRKSGKLQQARQVVEQGIEQLTLLPASLIDQMDDASLLALFKANGHSEPPRLQALADLYQEQGEILLAQGQVFPAQAAIGRALRLLLEAALMQKELLTSEILIKVQALVQRTNGFDLPSETRLALGDYYQYLLDLGDPVLTSAGIERAALVQALTDLQERSDESMNPLGD